MSFIKLTILFNAISFNAEADTGFPERGGVGCRGYGYFILGLPVVGHITRCTDKMSVDKILGDQTPVKIARGGGGGGGDKMLSILWDREGKMPILTKHFIFDTDGQAN